MGSATTRPIGVLGITTLVAAVTITGSRIQPVEISPPRLLSAATSVQLTALAEPAQILTDAVKAALSVAATVGWFAAFPITLPGSLIYGALVSLWASMFRLEQPPTIDPTAGLTTFFAVPQYLLQSSFTALGISLGLIEQPASPAAATHPTTVTPGSARAKASAAAIGSPGDILTNAVRLAVSVVGATAWYLATPLTFPLSIVAAVFIRGGSGLLSNPAVVSGITTQDWSNGLALFGAPFQAVVQEVSTLTSPAAVAHAAAGIVRGPRQQTIAAATTSARDTAPRAAKKPAASAHRTEARTSAARAVRHP
ncbi:MAG: hypothetical protein ACOYEV_19355 [Candidatus Nanopelagicales bacterium]